ncbi:hypothetical protein EZV73_26315 [Acidaminobacter sp. JC074]|uniref:hypothetical protein n=1 Tax=Acidaminobacter sp. JC074 TaxID=2530199 RepID=UPI001F0FA7AE|nr:hypothetical protein [Acidaminobacter sp. JC074]MCH4891120.1 hypothetical protein [Acidaminobacter sp. JC074]
MLIKEDKTFDNLREKSVMKWLEDLKTHDDIEVRGGVQIATEYIESLKKKIKQLEDKNLLKDKYLKKVKTESDK